MEGLGIFLRQREDRFPDPRSREVEKSDNFLHVRETRHLHTTELRFEPSRIFCSTSISKPREAEGRIKSALSWWPRIILSYRAQSILILIPRAMFLSHPKSRVHNTSQYEGPSALPYSSEILQRLRRPPPATKERGRGIGNGLLKLQEVLSIHTEWQPNM